MPKYKSLLFNFSASVNGGGLKRLSEFSRWFDRRGGTNFIISRLVKDQLTEKYTNNHYFIVDKSLIKRLFFDQSFIKKLPLDFRNLDLLYSYGIPIYDPIASQNWFHLSNISPFFPKQSALSRINFLRNLVLRKRIVSNLYNAEFISAESESSLSLLDNTFKSKFVVSVNGSDDEIMAKPSDPLEPFYAVSVGTQSYKRIDLVIKCFKHFKGKLGLEKLYICGDKSLVNKNLILPPDVILLGLLPRAEVIRFIEKSKLYISCTKLENSFNAASEGIFLAESSIISGIGPHQELLKEEPYSNIELFGDNFYFVERCQLSKKNIVSWDSIISSILVKAGIVL